MSLRFVDDTKNHTFPASAVRALRQMLTAAPWFFAASWAKAEELTAVEGTATLPHDLSPWGMFLHADVVVKVVMVGLVVASLATWTVWLAKRLELWKVTRRARAALLVLNEAETLAQAQARLSDLPDPITRLVQTAVNEVRSSKRADPAALKERISWLLERVEVEIG